MTVRSRMPRPRRAWTAAVAAALALTLAACADGLLPVPETGRPDEMDFGHGGYGGAARSVKLRGDTVVALRVSWTGTSADSVKTVPSAEAWAAFWAAAEESGVGRWRRRYANDDVVDGAAWHLRIVHGDWTLDTTGTNAYPDGLGREHDAWTPEFERLMEALGELVGTPLFDL